MGGGVQQQWSRDLMQSREGAVQIIWAKQLPALRRENTQQTEEKERGLCTVGVDPREGWSEQEEVGRRAL